MRPKAFGNDDAFTAYYDIANGIVFMSMLSFNETDSATSYTVPSADNTETGPIFQQMVPACTGLRIALNYSGNPESEDGGVWYLWSEENMPTAQNTEYISENNFQGSFDNYGFKPFMVPYLLEDQSQVKGCVIVVAGGAYYARCDSYEGYDVAKRFNELGYNAFVLQRRVHPYTNTDAFLDFQRSIRYLQANADKLGVEGTDTITAAGFSGGVFQILGIFLKSKIMYNENENEIKNDIAKEQI